MKLIILIITLLAVTGTYATTPKIETIELTNDNFAYIDGPIDLGSIVKDIAYLTYTRKLLPRKTPLYVIISSPGGYYDYAKVLTAFVSRMPNTRLLCRYCASAAGFLFEATDHPRLVLNNSELLMHEMYNPHYTAAMLDDNQLNSSLRTSSIEFNSIFAYRMRISIPEYQALILNRALVLTADAIVENGLADRLVHIKCSELAAAVLPETCSDENQGE